MMSILNSFVDYFHSTPIYLTVAYVAGLLTSQKVRDFAGGVPSGFRSAMAAVEAKARADIDNAIADVFQKFSPPVVKPLEPTEPPHAG